MAILHVPSTLPFHIPHVADKPNFQVDQQGKSSKLEGDISVVLNDVSTIAF